MKKVLVIAATLLALAGCANHTAGVYASSTGESRIDNSSFARSVSVGDLMARGEGGLLRGTATISSKVATDMRVQYKFTWYDTSGYTLDDEGVSWKSVKLHGKQQLQVSAVAPNPTASRFEVYVREAFSN